MKIIHDIYREGALKLMQLAKIHTEAIIAGEMKHGHLALVNPLKLNSTKSKDFNLKKKQKSRI